MSYIYEDGNIFPDDNDQIVKHNETDDLYLSLSGKVFIPLVIKDDELFIDREKPVLNIPSADLEKIESLIDLIKDMEQISVQVDVPTGDVPTMPDLNAGQGSDSDDDFDPTILDNTYKSPDDTDIDINYTYGTGDVVELTENDTSTDQQLDQDLDLADAEVEVIFGEAITAQRRVYQVRDPTTITDLIKDRHDISEPLSLDKIKHLIESMSANTQKKAKMSLGEQLLQVGLPSWIVPVACSELILQGDTQNQEVTYKNRKPGCDVEFDIPYRLAPRVDRMITDRDEEVPGDWFQSRRDYGINMMHLTDGQCSLQDVGRARITRQPITEYNYQINLDAQIQQRIDNKKSKEREREQESKRMRCGLAYAQAIIEPGAVKSITITKQSRATNSILGLAIYEPNNLSGQPQLIPVKCANRSAVFVKVLDEVVQGMINGSLTEEVFNNCHNLKPIDRILKTIKMGLEDLDVSVYKKISKVLSDNHPTIDYRHCQSCNQYLIAEDEQCSLCGADGTELLVSSWSHLHNQRLNKPGSFPLIQRMHPKRASVDYGRLHFQNELYSYVQNNNTKALPTTQHVVADPDAIDAVDVRSIQYKDGKYIYRHNGKFYTRDDYKAVIGAQHLNMLDDFTKDYPKINDVQRQRMLLQLAYSHRETQVYRANQRLLSGLVIDIIKDVPEAGLVIRYLNKLLDTENDDIYLTMLDQFQQMGVIVYDEHDGRYVVSDTNDMVICVCHKHYLDNGGFNGEEFFNVNGKCRYCRTTLMHIEQVTDPSQFTGRDMIAGSNEEVEDDDYEYLENLVNVVTDIINKIIDEQGWIISKNDMDTLFDSLKKDKELILHPYGRKMATTSVEDNSGDLRSFVQLQGQTRIFGKPKSKNAPEYQFRSKIPYNNNTGSINIKRLIVQYLRNTMTNYNDKLIDTSELRSVLSRMSATEQASATLKQIIANEGLIMSYFTLPILHSQSQNISIIMGYIASLLEIKYGVKQITGNTAIYVDSDGNEISEYVKNLVNMPMLHEVASEFSSVMYNKYKITISMLQQMSLEKQSSITYFRRMQNMFNHLMPNGKSCFNVEFTKFNEILFRSKENRPYIDERKQHYDTVLKQQRVDNASIYNRKPEGEKPMVRERRIAMIYDIAPSNILQYAPNQGQVDNIQEFKDCMEASIQRSYNGYLQDLRNGYVAASDKAKEITSLTDEADEDGSSLEVLTTTAYLAQGTKLLNEPTQDKAPEWKVNLQEQRETFSLQDQLKQPSTETCGFMSDDYGDIIRRRQIVVDPIYHTNLIPISKGRTVVGQIVDRSEITEPIIQDETVLIKLVNLENSYKDGINSNSIGGLFADTEDAIVNDGKGSSRQSYVFNKIPEKNLHSISVTHNEQLKKAREMRRIIKHMSGHKHVPDFMRTPGDPDEFKPWGELEPMDLTIRRIHRVQNIGISLVRILRWLGAPVTEQEMEIMAQHIQRARESNVIGADAEFKMERDQIDSMGYVLKDLFDIKMDLVKNSDIKVEAMKLHDYEAHYIEMYEMSYSNYQKLCQRENIDIDDSSTNMLNIVRAAIQVDLIKHMQYIGINGQEMVRDSTKSVMSDDILINPVEHTKFLETVAAVINALTKHAGPDIIDPNRSDIDWRYEERFMEYASKRKITTARSVKDRGGLNINTVYAGMKATGDFNVIDDQEEDDFDPMAVAAPDGYNDDNMDVNEDDPPDDEALVYEEDEGNIFQGEAEFDPLEL